jgi:hypothetical protein
MRPLAWLLVCALIGIPLLGLLVVGIVAWNATGGESSISPNKTERRQVAVRRAEGPAKDEDPREERAGVRREEEEPDRTPNSPSTVPPIPERIPPGRTDTEPVVIKVSADTLYQDYQKDVVAADEKYLNKWIELTGEHGKIEKDDSGKCLLPILRRRMVKPKDSGARIMTSREAQRAIAEAALNTRYEPAILAYVNPREISSARGIEENTPLTVRGRCVGTRKDPMTIPAFVILIEDAKITITSPVSK